MLRRSAIGLLTSALVSAPIRADGPPPGPAAHSPRAEAPPARGRPAYTANKPELARAYLACERLMIAKAPTLDRAGVVAVNVGMDEATNFYFAGDTPRTIGAIVDQLGRLDPAYAGLAPRLSLRLDRRVARVDDPTMTATLGLACPLPAGAPATLDVDIVALPPRTFDGVPIDDRPRVVGSARAWDPRAEPSLRVPVRLPWAMECTGTLAVRVVKPAGAPDEVPVTDVSLTRASLDAQREALLARLDALGADAAKRLARAVVAARGRAGTLADDPGSDSTLNLLSSPADRLAEVEREVAAIERGDDPYTRATGDRWLALGTAPPGAPIRLYVPARHAGADPDAPYPLVIALHGAGGDENLWMSGYGAGNFKDALDAHGAIGVAPQVGLGTFGPAALDAIIDGVAAWHPIDRDRVYVIGHSLGGGAAVAWARLRPGTFAAACSVAGVGTLAGAPRLPPTLSIAAEHDGLCTPRRLRADAERAKAAGLPVEYREIPDYGHVLVLGRVTREAVDWLMTHRRPGPAPAPTPPDGVARPG